MYFDRNINGNKDGKIFVRELLSLVNLTKNFPLDIGIIFGVLPEVQKPSTLLEAFLDSACCNKLYQIFFFFEQVKFPNVIETLVLHFKTCQLAVKNY